MKVCVLFDEIGEIYGILRNRDDLRDFLIRPGEIHSDVKIEWYGGVATCDYFLEMNETTLRWAWVKVAFPDAKEGDVVKLFTAHYCPQEFEVFEPPIDKGSDERTLK